MSGHDPALVARFDQQNAMCNDMLDQLVAIARDSLDEGFDAGSVAVRLAKSMHRDAPDKAATVAGFAVTRLAQQARERSS